MHYKLASISYTYPYKALKSILNHYDMYLKDTVKDDKIIKRQKYHLGVLQDYYEKELTEEEADKLLCELIMNHPYIEGSMHLKIEVYWYKAGSAGIYQTLTINNDDYSVQRPKEGCEQIKFRTEKDRSSQIELGA